jgi:hypothetical protein
MAGCATPPQTQQLRDASPDVIAQSVELSGVPFYPQRRYQCGPAALATVLQWSGVDVTPEALVPQVFVPARRGSLQPEMLATARRHGRAPYVLAPEPGAIIAELQAGHPVLVLQNLAFNWAPRWHYAVVIGFDPDREELILRSGTTDRHRIPLALFERTWRRADYWAVVVTVAERPPATAEELPWLRTVLALEQTDIAAAGRGWQAAVERWPDSVGAWIGLGNHRFHAGDLAAAVAAFEALLSRRPGHAPALNNLAHALARMGRHAEAETYAEQAVANDLGNPLYRETLAGIRRDRTR